MEKCNFCGNKNLKEIKTEYTYKHKGKYLLIDDVPCIQCEYCGEQYFEAKVLKQIEKEFSNIYSGRKKANKEIIVPMESFQELKAV